MKLLLARPRGFCAGVERAIDTVKQALLKWGPPIYVRHEIVHNRHVVEELQAMGAVFVDDLIAVPTGSHVVFSAHGVPPSVYAEAKKLNLRVIDATCPLVTKVHSAARRFVEKGYRIVLIGHPGHSEIIGTAGEAPDATTVVKTVEDVMRLPFTPDQKIAYLTQTTFDLQDVSRIIAALRQRYPLIETMSSSSICYATRNRQMALQTIAKTSQLVLVVGDPKSSNSNRLRELSEKMGIPSYLVNQCDEIKQDWLAGETIALTAGASTPEIAVQGCVRVLTDFGVKEVEEIVIAEENVVFQLPKVLQNS